MVLFKFHKFHGLMRNLFEGHADIRITIPFHIFCISICNRDNPDVCPWQCHVKSSCAYSFWPSIANFPFQFRWTDVLRIVIKHTHGSAQIEFRNSLLRALIDLQTAFDGQNGIDDSHQSVSRAVIVLADRVYSVCSEIPFRSGSENRWRDKYFSSSYKYFHFAATHQHPLLPHRHSKAICLLAVCSHRILSPLLERTGGRQCVNSQMGLIMQNCRSNRSVGVYGQKR